MTNWKLEPFEADDGTVPINRWLHDLSDEMLAALTTALDEVLAVKGLDLAR